MGKTPSRSSLLRAALDKLDLCLLNLKALREDDAHYRLVRDKVAEARDWLEDYRSVTHRTPRSLSHQPSTRRPRRAHLEMR